jgi:hypothetical protein
MGKRANGEGNDYQRANGTWEARMTYVDPETGERRRVSFYAKTARAARGDEEGTRAGRRRCAGQERQGVGRRLARTLARNDTRGVGSKGIDSRSTRCCRDGTSSPRRSVRHRSTSCDRRTWRR